MKITNARFRAVVGALREVGFSGLAEDEKEICRAFDVGSLRIEDDREEDAAMVAPLELSTSTGGSR